MPLQKFWISILLFLAIAVAPSCNQNNKSGSELHGEKIIRNLIKAKTTGGLVLYQAFLMHQDGSLIGRNNALKVGEDAELRLFVRGWAAPDGIMSIGASQNFISDKGIILWEDADVFSNTGLMTVDDAQVLRLKIKVSILQPEIKYYTTEIKVWNKVNPTQSVEASVKFKVVQ